MRTALSFIVIAWTLAFSAGKSCGGPVSAKKPPSSVERLIASLNELGGTQQPADIRRLVAVQLRLEKLVPAKTLAPRFVPFLFHSASRVRQIADRVLRRSGPAGRQVAVSAFHSRFRSSPADSDEVERLLSVADRRSDAVPALLERIYNDRKNHVDKIRLVIVVGLIRRRISTRAAQRIYRSAIRQGEIEQKHFRRRLLSIVIPTKEFATGVLLPLLESNRERDAAYALLALGKYPDPPKTIVDSIAKRLTHRSKLVFAAALVALNRKAQWKDVEPMFQKMSQSKSSEFRRRSLKILISFNPNTVTTARAVRSALPFETDDAMRLYLLNQLVRVAPNERNTTLALAARVAEDRNRKIRVAALEALASAGTRSIAAAKKLNAVLVAEKDYELRIKTLRTLQRIHPSDAKVQPILKKIEGELIMMRLVSLMKRILREQQKLQKATKRLNLESILGELGSK